VSFLLEPALAPFEADLAAFNSPTETQIKINTFKHSATKLAGLLIDMLVLVVS
jgi:hypothetical protein